MYLGKKLVQIFTIYELFTNSFTLHKFYHFLCVTSADLTICGFSHPHGVQKPVALLDGQQSIKFFRDREPHRRGPRQIF